EYRSARHESARRKPGILCRQRKVPDAQVVGNGQRAAVLPSRLVYDAASSRESARRRGEVDASGIRGAQPVRTGLRDRVPEDASGAAARNACADRRRTRQKEKLAAARTRVDRVGTVAIAIVGIEPSLSFGKESAMRKKIVGSLVVAGCLACGMAFADGKEPRTYQTSNMFAFGNPAANVAGGATLYRGRQGVDMRIATSGLNMNSSYTGWWVVFNNPAGCVGGVGLGGIANPAARASVLYAAGFVTGLGDSGNVTAHLDAGAVPDGTDVELGNGLEPGNGFGAEIHLVLRTHGLTHPGSVAQQIGSFNGGCNAVCANVQAAMFLSTNPE